MELFCQAPRRDEPKSNQSNRLFDLKMRYFFSNKNESRKNVRNKYLHFQEGLRLKSKRLLA